MTNFQKIVIGILIVVAIFIAYYFGYFLPKNNAQMLELQRQSLVLQAEKNEQERITKQQEKQQEEVDDIFRKNQECQTYKAGLDQDIPGASLTNVIFYSPSEKDCIVVQTFIANWWAYAKSIFNISKTITYYSYVKNTWEEWIIKNDLYPWLTSEEIAAKLKQ